ncbi:MAG: Cyclic di-GMP phosphodiesterase response regulator RpfG [Phycisphaerae bacterium]|nr:Cyclic di-GMP phosphodiesterase response regulator RpfG [Phycisphaerae bacterium]
MSERLPRVQFLDDEPSVLDGLRRLLRRESGWCAFDFSSDPAAVLAQASRDEIDVLVSDVDMPGMNGFELLSAIRATAAGERLPVIFLTGRQETDLKRRALDSDATDLLNKPVEREDLLARLRGALRLKSYQDALRESNTRLEERVRERTAELEESKREIVWRLAKAGELRDEQTGYHVMRVGWFSHHLAVALGVPPDVARDLLLAAPLHDIGKLGVPDAILRKRGPLSEQERADMQRHCLIGAAILRDRSRLLDATHETLGAAIDGVENPVLEMAARVARSHHEHWDGHGYPDRIAGEQIPLEARIVAVADVFDALCSVRPYKPACDLTTAAGMIVQAGGRQFDPAVVAAFQAALPTLRAVQVRWTDPGGGPGGEDAPCP